MKKNPKRGGAMAELLSRHNDHKAKNGEDSLRRELYEKELIRQKKRSIMAEIQRSESDLGGAEEAVRAEAPAVQTPVQPPMQTQTPTKIPAVPPQPKRGIRLPQPKAPQPKAPPARPQVPTQARPQVPPQTPNQARPQPQRKRSPKKENKWLGKMGLALASLFIIAAIIVTVTVLIKPKADGIESGITSVLSILTPKEETAPTAADVSVGAFEDSIGESLERVSLAPAGGKNLQLVYFNVYGADTVSCLTDETTVGALIDEMGITLSEKQVVRESTDNATMDGKVISIDTITYATETHTERIDFTTKYVDVQFVPRGQEQVHFKGSSGESTTTYNIKYVNGEVAEKTMVSQTVTKSPLTQVIYRGVGGTITVGGKSYSYSHYIDCKTTVYCLEGITASGKPVGYDVIAVDPRVIPLGTQVYVDDPYTYVGFRTAADTGGAIKGNFIDIWFKKGDPKFSSYGVRSARVYILD